MNKLLEYIIGERCGHYCHVIEVENTYDIENVCESIIGEYAETVYKHDIEGFLTSLDVIYLGDDEVEEQSVYDFDIKEYIKDTY